MYIFDTRIPVSIQIKRKLSSPADSFERDMIMCMVTTVLLFSIKAILVTRVTAGGHKDSVQVLQNISILYVKCLIISVCILVFCTCLYVILIFLMFSGFT